MLGRWESSAYQRYLQTPRDLFAVISVRCDLHCTLCIFVVWEGSYEMYLGWMSVDCALSSNTKGRLVTRGITWYLCPPAYQHTSQTVQAVSIFAQSVPLSSSHILGSHMDMSAMKGVWALDSDTSHDMIGATHWLQNPAEHCWVCTNSKQTLELSLNLWFSSMRWSNLFDRYFLCCSTTYKSAEIRQCNAKQSPQKSKKENLFRLWSGSELSRSKQFAIWDEWRRDSACRTSFPQMNFKNASDVLCMHKTAADNKLEMSGMYASHQSMHAQ